MRKTALRVFSVLLIGFRCSPQTRTGATGSIRGEVFTRSEGGERSVLDASAPGLNATLEVEVSPGATAAAPLELDVVAVNSFEDDPEIFLTEADRKWLKAMDCAFSRKVHHA